MQAAIERNFFNDPDYRSEDASRMAAEFSILQPVLPTLALQFGQLGSMPALQVIIDCGSYALTLEESLPKHRSFKA